MKIYDVEGFPNPARVRIALAEKGAQDAVEFVAIDVMQGEHRSEAFRQKNPDAVVPCLELEDGTCISQCNAITEYIDASFEGPSLTGTTAKERAVISMMNLRAENGLLNAVGTYFHHATPGLGPDLETDQCAVWGNRQKATAEQTMAYLDSVLASSDYLAGESFSVADITAFAGLAFADFAKIEVPETLTHLTEWRARVAARPSVSG
ncbi:glutathione S-transferase family protein [Cognatishimia maritima]|uniref:Glutathione S-transferase n=1 Tax=Cognatishimia maritima TaxID=870908 RepID=A0A1M5N792_9RHOB|nr:glutathione S-transferase [Cognatishimia maritima]SHG84883.1 Glutathione S-transferase [Cognatishimia maritima]